MHRYYPIYLQLEDRLCIVIGGGAVAERKVNALREAGARIRVVSPTLTLALQQMAEAGEILYSATRYEVSVLENAFLVFAATDDRQVNAQVVADAQAHGLLVNAADAFEAGDFVTPATVRRGEFCLSLMTSGSNPRLTGRLRAEMEARFGPEYGTYVELLGEMRAYIRECSADTERRLRAHDRLLDAEAELCGLLRGEQYEEARQHAQSLVAEALEAG